MRLLTKSHFAGLSFMMMFCGLVNQAFALECIIEGKPAKVKVQWANKDIAEFRQMASADCEGTIILEGEATVYYSNQFGESVRIQLKQGQSITTPSLKAGANSTGGIASVVTQMSRILHGDKSTETGQRRAVLETKLNGFPYRTIMPPKEYLEINLAHTDLQSLDNFTLVNDKLPDSPVYSLNKVTQLIKIEASKFEKGARYTWLVKDGNNEFKGSFRVANQKEEKEIDDYRKELEVNNVSATPLGKAIAEAGLYNEFGYEFDSARVLANALQ